MIFLIIYILLFFITWGGFVAFSQGGFPERAKERFRSDLSFYFVISLIQPVAFIVCIGLSGFFEHGWQLRRK